MSHEEIERAAYFLWEEAGRPDGRSQEFWARAEAAQANSASEFIARLREEFRRKADKPPVQIATEAVRKQLSKVLDQGDNRAKAERVRSTLKAIKNRIATFFAGNDV